MHSTAGWSVKQAICIIALSVRGVELCAGTLPHSPRDEMSKLFLLFVILFFPCRSERIKELGFSFDGCDYESVYYFFGGALGGVVPC